MNHASTVVLLLAVLTPVAASSAEIVDQCPADKYKDCSVFRTSRTIEDYASIIDSQGFARSKGSWKIRVDYRPPETCAKVSLTMDVGPFDGNRQYDQVFHRGGGVISDSGYFLHETGDVESGLRILTSSCRVPDSDSNKLDADAEERRELEEERERLALEEERERLAIEEERERMGLAAELERLAMEVEKQRREEEEARLAQARSAQEKERERQRLAQERQRLEAQRIDRRLAELERAAERKRLEEEGARKRKANTWAAVGILSGIVDGLAQRDGGGRPGTELLESLIRLDGATSMDSNGSPAGGSPASVGSCAQAQRRAEQIVRAAQNQSFGGMCGTARHYVSTLQAVRRELASGGCPAHTLGAYDRAIAEARQTASASCN